MRVTGSEVLLLRPEFRVEVEDDMLLGRLMEVRQIDERAWRVGGCELEKTMERAR